MNACTKEQLIAFEERVKAAWEDGQLPYLIHLCGGNEDKLIKIFERVQPGDWVFSTHRNHYHALLSGMAAERLLTLIHQGNSMFVYGKADAAMPVNFLTSSVLAGTCGIAAGVAWALRDGSLRDGQSLRDGHDMADEAGKRPPHVWCFLGDGAEEQGHFYEAAMFVEANALPCAFIIEDNNRSVDTNRRDRRGAHTEDVEGLDNRLGCVMRYHYTPTYPHAGSGCKHQIQFKV